MNSIADSTHPIAPRSRNRRRGTTLVEVTISTLLTAFVLVVALQATAGTMLAWRASEQIHDGMSLAHQLLMSEVLTQRYKEPGISLLGLDLDEILSDRSTWDDVDDYDGLNEYPPQDQNGNNLPGYGGWRRTVSVVLVQALSPQNVTGSDEGLKRITVTVTDPTGRSTTMVAFRSEYGALEQSLTSDATLQTGVASEIQIGTSTKLENGANFSNHAQDQ